MPELHSSVVSMLVLGLACMAAVTDARHGIIPNRLTLPVLTAAPLAYLLSAGPGALRASLIGSLLCAAVPGVLFVMRAMGGGDVKLLAALGALAGPADGVRLELAAFLVAGGFAIVQLIAQGGLFVGLRSSLGLLLGRRPMANLEQAEVAETSLRFGPPLLLAALFVCGMEQWR